MICKHLEKFGRDRNGQSILFWGVQAEASGEVSVRTLKSNHQVIWYDENTQCRKRTIEIKCKLRQIVKSFEYLAKRY